MSRAFLFVLVILPTLVFSQRTIPVESVPSWVEPVTYPAELPDTINTGGYSYLLLERQFNESTKQSFFRRALKINTEKGLESASSFSINFDPSYQRLSIVGINIFRNGKLLDKTRSTQIETIRREANMERMLYDKSLDAVVNLTETQIGDIIEYAYVIRGEHPLLKNKISRSVYFNYGDPIGRLFTRLICPSSAALNLKQFNGAIVPEKKFSGNSIVYTWDLLNVPALLSDDQTPSWYDPYANIEFSEYQTWADVAKWALPLYKIQVSSPAVDKKVDEIKEAFENTEEQIRACIQFVQDEIRYLGFEDGVRGFKPYQPQQVFNQRFGDCKDKALLLTYMLGKLGVESHPALVHSSMGKVLNESLPSPLSFDHCIVQMNFRDSVYWIDATMTLQRGKLKSRAFPNYYYGLVIDDETLSLTPMLQWKQVSSALVKEDFFIDVIGKSASLTVKTVYAGGEADGIRNYWKSTSANEIKKSYTEFYANDYPDIQAVKNVEFTDDEDENLLTIVEQYVIPNFWIFDSTENRHKGEFYARVIASNLSKPTTKARRMPLRITHPASVDQVITVHLPEEWSIKDEEERISSSGFLYTGSTAYNNKKIVLTHSYKSLSNHLQPEETREHIKKLDDALSNLSFQITWRSVENKQLLTSAQTNTPFVVMALAAAVGFFFLFKKLYELDPQSQDYQVEYEGVGGWMLLPALGLFLTVVVGTFDLFNGGYFDSSWWRGMTDASYSSYNPSHSGLVLLTLLYGIFIVLGSIFLLILMIKRRTSFPLMIISFIAIKVAYSIIREVWLSSVMESAPFKSYQIYIIILTSAVWIPYFIFSDRVKGTFRERRI